MISGVDGQQKRELKAVEESKWTAVLRVISSPVLAQLDDYDPT